MRHGLTLLAVALAVTGCGGAGAGKAQTMGRDPAGSGPPSTAQLPTPTSSERCDASALAYLVGHPRTEIPVPVDPSRRRVSCTGCTASSRTLGKSSRSASSSVVADFIRSTQDAILAARRTATE